MNLFNPETQDKEPQVSALSAEDRLYLMRVLLSHAQWMTQRLARVTEKYRDEAYPDVLENLQANITKATDLARRLSNTPVMAGCPPTIAIQTAQPPPRRN